MGILYVILLGLVVGALAKRIVPGSGVGIGVGVAGAVVGGYVGQAVGVGSMSGFDLPILAFGTSGALLLLFAQSRLAGRAT